MDWKVPVCGVKNIYLLKQTNQLIGQDLLPRLGSARLALKPDQSYFQTDLLQSVKILMQLFKLS